MPDLLDEPESSGSLPLENHDRAPERLFPERGAANQELQTPAERLGAKGHLGLHVHLQQESGVTAVGFERAAYSVASALHPGDVLSRSGHTATMVSIQATSGAASMTGTAATLSYKRSAIYTAKVSSLRVHKGAGNSYAALLYSELTCNAQVLAGSNGALKKGATMNRKATKAVGDDV